MLVSFMFAVIAAITITLKHIEPIAPAESSLVETIVTEITTTSNTTGYTSTLTTTETTSSSTSSITTTESITSSTTEYEITYTTTKDDIIVVTGYQIIVIPDETSKATTKTAKTTTVTTTTYNVTTVTTTTTVASHSSQTIDNTSGKQFIGTFQGTYYVYPQGTHGGSGRELIDCSIGNGEVKGSISSRSLFNQFKYNVNGRTMVYIESESCKSLCGYYYLDDSTGEYVLGVIDFFYTSETNSPFYGIGRLYDIKVYV